MEQRNILEFREACLQANVDASPCRDISLVVRAGDAILITTPARGGGTPLCDAAQGLVEPLKGKVAFLGHSWDAVSPYAVSVLRGKIGRVFCSQPWISNLTIYDNIVLATRHHTRLREAAILTGVERLAKVCGVDLIPAGRADTVAADTLQRLQWIRAFLGQPSLVLLEHPAQGAATGGIDNLLEVIMHARSEGTAIVWVTTAPSESSILSFTKRYALRNGTLLPLGSDEI